MGAQWARWGEVLLACLMALPVVIAITVVRSRHTGWCGAIAEVVAVAGTLPWLWMVLTPLPQEGDVHLMPFGEVRWYLNAPPADAFTQLIGNLAVFASFGAAASVRWRMPLRVVALAAFAGSVTVETWQYLANIGRIASIDDVILNTAGGVLGALLTRRWWRIRQSVTGGSPQARC